MSAYRVTMLDCDLCGEVYDPGPEGIRARISDVRRMAARESGGWPHQGHAWRSSGSIDVCPKHWELSIEEVRAAVEARFAGDGS